MTGIDDGPSQDCTPDVCPYGAARFRDLIWVTRDGVEEVTSSEPPTTDAVLTPVDAGAARPHQLATDAEIHAVPGDLVILDVSPERGSVQRVIGMGQPAS